MNCGIKNFLLFFAMVFTANIMHAQINLTVGNGYISQPAGVARILVKKEGVTDVLQIPSLTSSEQSQLQQYVDGFGRSIEDIAVGASPTGKDIISFKRYDEFGKEATQFLPYEASSSSGLYRDPATAITEQASYFTTGTTGNKIPNDIAPFSATTFEANPLQRPVKQGGVGDGFQPSQHYKSITYRMNTTADAVRLWDPATGLANTTYTKNTLSVTEVVDEAGGIFRMFYDKFGKLILKREIATSSTFLFTYYIYDNAGNISCVVPPKAVAIMASSAFNIANTPELIFQYWYDNKNRIVRKKVPGAQEVFYVYDPLDRLVLMQDGNLRNKVGATKRWVYFKYDNAGRQISQGIYTHPSAIDQPTMQAYVNGQSCYASNSTNYFEARNTAATAPEPGYTNQCFPTSGTEPISYNYYDDYTFADGNSYSQQLQGLPNEAAATDLVFGLKTGIKKKILGSGSPGTWITEAYFYDKFYHVIQIQKSNQFTAVAGSTGVSTSVQDISTTVIDFAGKVVQSKQITTSASQTIAVDTRCGYDNAGRVQKIWQTNPGASEVLIAQYEYNALGKLVDKKLHSTNSGVNFLQSVDYRYNIRGQLTSINNSRRIADGGVTNDDENDLFGMQLLYDKVDNASNGVGNTANFTGLISAVKWSSSSTPGTFNTGERCFLYTYDKVYRLTTASYKASNDVTGGAFNKHVGGYNENFSYDENGNILSLTRWAMLGNTPTLTQIDNLSYTYKNNIENKLDNITDGISGVSAGYGFRNITNSAAAYSYDDNGNLTVDPKKGTVLDYNELNKVSIIQKSANAKIEYRYDAAGIRISKLVYDNSTTPTATYEYIGGYVFKNGNLSHYAMAEGRVRNDGGSSLNLKMEYFITDHQGNVRISFEDNGSGVAVIKQETSYYAFGMQMAGGYLPTSPNRNLYNAGSEWQAEQTFEDGATYDLDGTAEYYSTYFREYDPVIGRFNGIDPMSTNSENWTPYQFGNDNPICLNDPRGDDPPKVNPAQFKTAMELLEYIQQNGISNFERDYIWWSFSATEGKGIDGGTLSDWAVGDATVGYNSNGDYGVQISWTGRVNNGNGTTLDEITIGRTFIKISTWWATALGWGEEHRDASHSWINGEQHYDVMWQHNYDLFLQRKSSGANLAQTGDRQSYLDGISEFENVLRAHKEGRVLEGTFVGILSAPLVLMAAAEIGVGSAFSSLYEAAQVKITTAGIDAYVGLQTFKNYVVTQLGNAIVTYGPTSMMFNPALMNAMNTGYKYIVNPNHVAAALWFIMRSFDKELPKRRLVVPQIVF